MKMIQHNEQESQDTHRDLPPVVKKLLRRLFGTDTKKKERYARVAIVSGVLALLLGGYIGGIIAQSNRSGSLSYALGLPIWKYYLSALVTLSGWKTILFIFAVCFVLLLLVLKKNNELDRVKTQDDRGVEYSTHGTYGTAEWLSREEAEEIFEVGNIDDVQGTILGQFTESGEEAVCLRVGKDDNQNKICIGPPGSGKSFSLIRNEIFQAIKRGESICISDIKGEHYAYSNILREAGYKIWVYNLKDPQHSDSWNCVSEIIDPATGNVDETRTAEFSTAIMQNTIEGEDDQFWGPGEQNLFKSILWYVAWRRETSVIAAIEYEGRKYAELAKTVLPQAQIDELLDKLDAESQYTTMLERENALATLVKAAGTLEKPEDVIAAIKNEAPPCEMSAIYYLLVTNDIANFERLFKQVPISHPAGIAWSVFANGNERTKPGFVQGLGQRLQLFQMRDIRRITTNDDIEPAKLGEEKIALFVVLSDKNKAMRPITSLFFYFLFKDICDAADYYGPATRRPVNVICEEFKSLGIIPELAVTVSNGRSRRLRLTLVVQSIAHFQAYGDDMEAIIGCCDTIIVLGCNDDMTADFVSNLSGIASIRVSSTRDSRGSSLGNRAIMQGYMINEGDGKRFLMNPDEVRRMPKHMLLVYHAGANMLRMNRCSCMEHPLMRGRKIEESLTKDYPLARLKYSLSEELDAFIRADVTRMTRRNRSIVNAKTKEQQIQSKQRPPINPTEFFDF